MLRPMAQMAMHLISRLKMPLLTGLLSMPKALVGRRWRVMHAIKNSVLGVKAGGQNKIPKPPRTILIPHQEKEEHMDRRQHEGAQEVVRGQEKVNASPLEVVNNTAYLYLAFQLVCTFSLGIFLVTSRYG